ncbi:MAG: helix-turn-helix domain-containing protein [Candidatus Magasanikbacteria bacterium]
MEITQLLQSFGLSEVETKVYLKAMQKNYLTAGQVAQAAGLKRSSVYHTLRLLVDKGLMISAGSKVEKFKSQPPQQLVSILERKQEEIVGLKEKIQESISSFPSVFDDIQHAPYIEYYYGLENLKNLMEKIFLSTSKVIYTFGVLFKYMETEENVYIRNFLKKRVRKGIVNYSILHDKPADKTISEFKKMLWNVRLAPEKLRGKNSVMITIVDDMVIFINFLPEMFGFLVHNKSFSQSMKAMWDSVWEDSLPIE